MVYPSVGKNVHPAHSAKINLYHVDAGFFVRLIGSQISLRAPSEILSFRGMARRSGPSVSGRCSRIHAALYFNEQNMRVIFANNIRLQMTAPIIAVQDRISLGSKIEASEILSRFSNLKISHFLLSPRRTENCVCARDKVRSQSPFLCVPSSDIPYVRQIRIRDKACQALRTDDLSLP